MNLVAASLEALGCEVASQDAVDFDAFVILGDSWEAVEIAVHLRDAGFRGVIVASDPGPSDAADMLRTAGINAVAPSANPDVVVDVLFDCLRRVVTDCPPNGLEHRLDPNSRLLRVGTVQVVLSDAQYRLMMRLLQRSGEWWKASALLSDALGTHHAPDSSLARVHMNAIRGLLGIARWCIQSERTFGYQFVTNPDALPRLGSRRLWNRHGAQQRDASRSGVLVQRDPIAVPVAFDR